MNNTQAKIPTSMALRPALIHKLDRLSHKVGLSRSELVSRVLGEVVEDLLKQEVQWIRISRTNLIDIITE